METIDLPNEAKICKNQKGIKYAYFDYPYWDQQKGYGCHHRLYIGLIEADGSFIPNVYYLSRISQGHPEKPPYYLTKKDRDEYILKLKNIADEPKSSQDLSNEKDIDLYYGSVYLLEQISSLLGIEDDLAECFPDTYKQILSIVYYLVLESHSPLYRFNKWARDHEHPYDSLMASQRISELIIDNITERQKKKFYKLQITRRKEDEYLAYDTTSISSTSKLIKYAKYGRNKDKEKLPLINLAMLTGQQSRLPVYYRVLPGNISDVSTVKKLLKDLNIIGIEKVKLVLDRGFYSADNINLMCRDGHKFILSARRNIALFKNLLKEAKQILSDNKLNIEFYNPKLDIYCIESKIKWQYIEKDDNDQIILRKTIFLNAYICYNKTRGEEERKKFLQSIDEVDTLCKENKELDSKQKSLYKEYFIKQNKSEDTNFDIIIDRNAVLMKSLDYGYFILVSNDEYSAYDVISIYRKKDIIEKVFDNLKDRLEFKRTEVHSNRSLNNKIFVLFISLLYISYIDKKIKENNTYKNKTMDSVFDDLDNIKKCYHDINKYHISEITEKQRKLYEIFSVTPPA